MGYLLENCLFDRLSSEIIDQCQPYTCSKDADINSFFHQDKEDNYSDYLSEMMAYTHCFYTDEKDKVDENGKRVKSKMVCAFSLSTSALRADALPNRKRNKLNKVIPNDKRRPQYPAILIGQLCVFDGFGLHSFPYNVGDEMMDLIKTMAINPDNDFAVRYLVVDALNIPNVTDYYLRNGFKFMFESDEEELHCLRGYPKNSIWKRIKNICHRDTNDEQKCKTRLMHFDLIVLKQ